MPRQRSSMHLDTIISFVDNHSIVSYEKMVCKNDKEMKVIQYRLGQANCSFENIFDMLNNNGLVLHNIFCGGGIFPYDEREQWQDAANLLTLAPSVCIGYDRNRRTLSVMESAGFTTITSQELITAIQTGKINPEEFLKGKWMIVIPSSELSRARGGTHCLGLPILRDSTK